jgi:hypothetical protein
MDVHAKWLSQISIMLREELWGPNSMNLEQAPAIVIEDQAELAQAAARLGCWHDRRVGGRPGS